MLADGQKAMTAVGQAGGGGAPALPPPPVSPVQDGPFLEEHLVPQVDCL